MLSSILILVAGSTAGSLAASSSGPVCPDGMFPCNGTCIDMSTDTQNCGACGNVCPANAICIDGSCSDMSPQICIDGDCSYPIAMQLRNL